MSDQNNTDNPYTGQSVDEWICAVDRKQRMLTRDDRKYLLGKASLSSSAAYTAEHRIRNRINGVIRDFAFLVETENIDFVTGLSQVPPSSREEVIIDFTATALRYNIDYLISEWMTNVGGEAGDSESDPQTVVEKSGDVTEDIMENAFQIAIESVDELPKVGSVNVDIEITVENE